MFGQPPNKDPFADLSVGAGLDDPFADLTATAPKKTPTPSNLGLFSRGVSAAMEAGGNIAENVFRGLGKVAEVGKERSWFTDVADRFKETSDKHTGILGTDAADTKVEKATEFVGRMIPQVAVGGALAKSIFNPITSTLASTRFAGAASRIAQLATKNPTAQKAIASGLVSAPAEFAGSAVGSAVMDEGGINATNTTAGGVIGTALNMFSGARGLTQVARAMAEDGTAKAVTIPPENIEFQNAVSAAHKSMGEFKKVFRTVLKDDPIGTTELPKAAMKSLNAMQRILHGISVDGPTPKLLARLEAAQTAARQNLDAFGLSRFDEFSKEQMGKMYDVMQGVDNIKLPEYNFAAGVPSVPAVQRMQDNLSRQDQIRMDPTAPLGTAESLIASTRPESPSAYTGIAKHFQRLREQYGNYKQGLKIFSPKEETAISPFSTGLRLAGNNGRVYQNLEVQPMSYDAVTNSWKEAEVDGKKVLSLSNVLKISGTDNESLAKLNGYLVAKQVADGSLNIDGFDADWAAQELSRITTESPNIPLAAEEFFRRTKHMADYLRDLVGDDVANEWMKRDYAPASRAYQQINDPFAWTTKRKVKGGSELVYNPIAKHIENVSIAIAATEKTRMWSRLYDVVAANPDQFRGSATIIKQNKAVLQRTLDAVKAANPDLGEVEARRISNLLAGMSPDKSAKSVTFLKDGQPVTIQFSDDFKELFNGFGGPDEMGDLARVGQKLENVPRTIFSLVNDLTGIGPMRDMAEVFVNDPNLSGKPRDMIKLLTDTWRGYKEVAGEGELYQKVLASGGGIGGRYIGPNSGVAQNSMEEVLKKARGEGETLLRKMERISANLSQASRMGAAIRVFEKGGSDDEMARLFRDVIADPQQVGSKMQAAARITAFMNMGVQSVDKAARQFRNNPLSTVIKGSAGIAAPAAVLWWYGKDDAEIQELRGSKGGENYFYVRLPGDEGVTRIPKPYLYGQVFGTGVEALLDHAFKTNPQGVDQLMKGILGQMSVNVIPLTTQTLANTGLGQKYLGISEGLIPSGGSTNSQMPEDQRFQNTTTLARNIASVTGIPASNVDDIFRTFLTNEPYKALAYVDRKVTNRTAPTSEDIPLLGKFRPTVDKSNVGSINQFYSKVNEYSDIFASMQDAERKGDQVRLKKLITEHKNEIEQAAVFAEGLKDLQELRGAANLINENTLLSPEERRERITKLNTASRDYTRLFLQAWNKKNEGK